MPSLQPYPIIVGVTGHRSIGPRAVAGVESAVEAVLVGLQKECPLGLHVMTGDSHDADAIVARVAVRLQIPRIILRFESEAGTEPRSADARLVTHLPLRSDETQAVAWFDAFMLRRSHFMLTLWDGAIVGDDDRVMTPAEARKAHAAIRDVRAGSLFTGMESPLEADPDAPWIQIVAPRSGVVLPPQACEWLFSCSLFHPDGALIARDIRPECLTENLPPWHKGAIAEINRLNASIVSISGLDRAVFDAQVGFLGLQNNQGIAALQGPEVDALISWQAAPDALAQRYQRKLLGVWSPSRGPIDMLRRA